MKVALTGAATGIGLETAKLLKAGGAHIVAFDIAEPTVADRWIATDLSDPASLAAAAEAAAPGPFDALINCAGLPPRADNARAVLAVNFLGLRAFTHAMLPQLADGGAIVNVASRAGSAWRENLTQVKALMALTGPDQLDGFLHAHGIDATRAYNLSKEAVIVHTMAQTADLLGRGLRANSVSPAAVATGILDDFITAFGERARKGLEMAGRAGNPDEIARLIVFLASPDSGWIRGQDILIDGGVSAMVGAMQLDL